MPAGTGSQQPARCRNQKSTQTPKSLPLLRTGRTLRVLSAETVAWEGVRFVSPTVDALQLRYEALTRSDGEDLLFIRGEPPP